MSDVNGLQDKSVDSLEESFEVPDKYKGKTVAEIAKMHMDAEAKASRLGNEVGTLRQMADELLGLKQAKQMATQTEQRKPITTDEILENPDEALERAIEDHPDVHKTKEEIQRLRAEISLTKFEREHPSYQDDLQNPEFVEWVKSNKVRVALGVAANGGDYEAANSLWSLWDERNSELKESKAKEKELRKKQEKLGTLESGGTTGLETDRVYSRQDFIDVQIKAASGDPSAQAKWRDPAFQAERLKAYAEKRVR